MQKNNILFSPIETQRLSYNIYRAKDQQLDIEKINLFVNQHQNAILIYRVPVQEQDKLHLLNKYKIQYLVADTLVYYSKDLNLHTHKNLKNNLKFVNADSNHLDVLKELASSIFKDYKNHYSSNPFLKKEDILDGFVEWAISFITTPNENKKCFIIFKENSPVAFSNYYLYPDNNSVEGVLNGVHPNFSGKGIYRDFIIYGLNFFKNLGYGELFTSTQIQNLLVQRVWNQENFLIKEAYLTFHIFSKDIHFFN